MVVCNSGAVLWYLSTSPSPVLMCSGRRISAAELVCVCSRLFCGVADNLLSGIMTLTATLKERQRKAVNL